ncbi:tol-pal system protein YbgF [Pseudooceanicola aestuarii]|uniref:tol-pal system protein YbgF n=1 Tax=Pseudooceanicola aestuarii TaxID=2697319 RepID=UPI0030843B29
MRLTALLLSATLLFPVSALAQDRQETLADIRQQLTTLHVELQRLKRELSTTGSTGQAVVSGSPLERLNAIESEVQRLTSKTETLEFRIDSVVKDGTNRIGDLEFRLVELEGGDTSRLGETTTLGGGSLPQGGGGASMGAGGGGGTTLVGPGQSGPQLAMGEQEDFDAAQQALDAGEHAAAARAFLDFSNTYPGSPLEARAQFGRGRALEADGNIKEAARAYLAAFTVAPEGEDAPSSLYRLGRLLGQLGQSNEACVTLGEVPRRFPGSAAAGEAQAELRALSCS